MTESRPTILYVDDEAINCKVFEHSFRKHFEVVTALSGREALELLEKDGSIEQVVCDIKMPEMDGFEFLEMARRRFPEKKYYFLSGFDRSTRVDEAIRSGQVVAYFQKPMDRELILSYLEKDD